MSQSRLLAGLSIFALMFAIGMLPAQRVVADSSIASPFSAEIVADADTVLLDHFDGTTLGTAIGPLNYQPGQAGLDQAGVFAPGNFVRYALPGWYSGTGASADTQGTVEAWVKPDVPSSFLNFNWNNSDTQPTNGHVLYGFGISLAGDAAEYNTWNTERCCLQSGLTGSASIPNGVWTHLAVSWSPTGSKLYVNGQVVASSLQNVYPALSDPIYVYLNNWGGEQFVGLIDELHISKIQRSDAVILAHAQLPISTPTPTETATSTQTETPISSPTPTATATASGSISGTIYEADGITPIENAFVAFNGGDFFAGAYFDSACTDAAGHYTVSNVPLYTPIQVQAAPPWANCGQWIDHVQQFWQHTEDPSNQTSLTLTTQNPQAADINFNLRPGGVISGTVYAADATTPLEHIAVSFRAENGYNNSVCTDASGHYALHGAPFDLPMRMHADAYFDPWCNASADYVSEHWQETTNSDNATFLTVTALSPSQSDINFTLDAGGSVSGTVYAADGTTPVQHVVVSLDGNYFSSGACTDALGHYTVHDVPFGVPFRAQAAPVWGNWCGGSNDYAPEFWPEKQFADAASVLSVSPPTPNLTGIDFTLNPAPAYLKANPDGDTVHAYRWAAGVQVTINIDRPSTGPGVDFSATLPSAQASWDSQNPDDLVAEFDLSAFNLQVGDEITATGGGITRSVTVAALTPVRWFVGLGTGTESGQISVEQAVVDAFNTSHPAIELLLEIQPNDQARDILLDEIANGNPPDLVGPTGWMGANALHGHWLDLAPLITASGYDTGQFNPALVNMYNTEEGQVGLPFALYSGVLYYKKGLFDAAGLNYPPASYGDLYEMPNGDMVEWNYETLRTIARLLTLDATGKNASDAGFDAGNIIQYGYFPQWQTHPNNIGTLWGAGSLYSGTAGNYTASIPSQWDAAWKWNYDGMWGSQPFIPTFPQAGTPDFGLGNVFNSGKLAMAITQSWYVCCIADAGADWDLAALPAYNGQMHGRIDADTFRILNTTAHADVAFSVMTYLLDDGSAPLLGTYGAMGARTATQDSWLSQKAAQYPFVTNWDVIKAGLNYPDVPNTESWMPSYNTAWDRLQTFGNLTGNTPGLNMDAEIAQLRADLQDIFNYGQILTPTPTVTSTHTLTPILTVTSTRTVTPTLTATPARTLTPTPTATSTQTFTATPSPTPTRTATSLPTTVIFSSLGAQDGWVLETSENSNAGGTLNAVAPTFNLGDNAAKSQYRGILSFSTGSLPDTASISTITLKLQKSSITGGGNPVSIFLGFMVDVKTGFFGTTALQAADFQASPSASYGPFTPLISSNTYSINLSAAKLKINKLATGGGLTQIRLRFKLDDNNNAVANILSLFSGNAPTSNRPQLVISYTVP